MTGGFLMRPHGDWRMVPGQSVALLRHLSARVRGQPALARFRMSYALSARSTNSSYRSFLQLKEVYV